MAVEDIAHRENKLPFLHKMGELAPKETQELVNSLTKDERIMLHVLARMKELPQLDAPENKAYLQQLEEDQYDHIVSRTRSNPNPNPNSNPNPNPNLNPSHFSQSSLVP